MKKIFIILAVAFSHFFNVYGQKDKLDQLFDKYQEEEGVTSIKIAKPMFGMLSNLNIEDSQLEQIQPLLAKINGLKILISENPEDNKGGNARMNSINKEISSYISNLNYSEIMSVKNGGSKIKFLSSEAKNGILDNLLLSIHGDDGENILVMLDGKLSMDDVNKIINSSENKINTTTNNTRSGSASENSSYLNGEARNVGEFTGIQVSSGVNVVYKQESPINVKVIADADKLKYVVTKVENGILKVYVDNKGVKNLKFKNLNVNVSTPRMENIQTNSGARFTTVNSVNENNMNIEVSSGSEIKGKFNISNTVNVSVDSGSKMKADINSGTFIFKGTSGSNSSFEGKTDRGNFEISSGAVCKSENFTVNVAHVESSSGGNISLDVREKLKVSASSGGVVKYKGNPELESNISKMSGGNLQSIQ
ncbi:DUF4252 domain-containing protein [Chryseobacterium sp. GMJ5]|uniref:DUF4252 domain-containing protein n=1 Tax=Chryseobacterium gilvum TaxID=2976534 RepID=A0ABT2VZJ4_9FLAO|nr:DUF4252 domain-containing protein [Chryseobacterium gilvum]MCU7615351.1 DUF4252 domain-containing protein [Chryseobacterium gilvum]